jgi:hypothetical protein
MPLPAYGVLIGTLNHFTREDPNTYGSWYHGTLSVDTPAGQYEGAVDVSTPSGIRVQYRVVRHLSRHTLSSTLALPLGWSPLASTRSSGAIDYMRSPFFGIGMAASHFGFWLFRRDSLIGRFLRWLESLRNPWVDSTGDNALNALETQLLGSVRVFVFGAPSPTGLGVQNVHLNQGTPRTLPASGRDLARWRRLDRATWWGDRGVSGQVRHPVTEPGLAHLVV